jgi:hypothetical protein
MAMPWWFVVFCLLFPVQVCLLVGTQRNLIKNRCHLAGLREEATALRDMAAAMEQVMVLQLALWRITWGLPNHRRTRQ